MLQQQNSFIKNEADYDLSRKDKPFAVTVPTFEKREGVVFYQLDIKDLINNQNYKLFLRYKQLKNIHQSLLDKYITLPEFPTTHFWHRTNEHPQRIEERREKLELYLHKVLNDPYLRGTPEIKSIIKTSKHYSNEQRKRFSSCHTLSNQELNTGVSDGRTLSQRQVSEYRKNQLLY